MIHELVEADLKAQGVTQAEAHELALKTHPLYSNYDPEVICQYPQLFSDGWYEYWGIPH